MTDLGKTLSASLKTFAKEYSDAQQDKAMEGMLSMRALLDDWSSDISQFARQTDSRLDKLEEMAGDPNSLFHRLLSGALSGAAQPPPGRPGNAPVSERFEALRRASVVSTIPRRRAPLPRVGERPAKARRRLKAAQIKRSLVKYRAQFGDPAQLKVELARLLAREDDGLVAYTRKARCLIQEALADLGSMPHDIERQREN